jgi:CRISPR-associated protein Cmr2
LTLDLEFLNKKIIAYFHDPPWKYWILKNNRTYLIGSEERKKYPENMSAHEADALELISRIMDHGAEHKPLNIPMEVKQADVLSSSIDRWVISLLYEEEGEKSRQLVKPERPVKKNIFAPHLKIDIPEKGFKEDGLKDYINELEKIANGVPQELRYHALYFAAPLLWYRHFDALPPLADTRVLTHTIFDHASASAAMVNILKPSQKWDTPEFTGSIVSIEVLSVQELISLSRKTRDLWASSWLSSFILWKAIEPFVEKYGPDVVLRPELSLNPFYVSWLMNKLSQSNASSDAMGLIEKLAKAYANYEKISPGEYPWISAMSEKVVLLLPEEDAEEVKREALKSVKSGWKELFDDVIGDLWPSMNEKEREYLKEAGENPPITLNISSLKVKDIYEEYKKKVESFRSSYGNLEFVHFLKFMLYRINSARKFKVGYGASAQLVKALKNYTSNESYKVCSVCGTLPALFADTGKKIKPIREVKEEEIEDLLCPYCAVKRNLQKFKVPKNSRVPSTSELAMYRYLESKKLWMKTEPEYAENLCKCYSGDAEACKTANIKGDDLEELKKNGGLYYAIIRGDADFMGSGVWSGLLKKDDGNFYTLKEYILEAVDQSVKEEFQKGDSGKKLDEITQFLVKLDDFLFNEGKGGKGERERIPLTFTYIYALSRALSAQAVIDGKILREMNAYPVYIGGDDILAISPIFSEDENKPKIIPLEIIKSTRRSFWEWNMESGAESIDGFKQFRFEESGGRMIADSLRSYGRSYSIYIAHYKDPLPLSLFYSHELLEKKDVAKEKDIAFIAYGRGIGGIEELRPATVPLSKNSKLDYSMFEVIEYLWNKIKDNTLSKSVIRDALELEKYLRGYPSSDGSDGKKRLMEGFLIRLIERNVPTSASGAKSEILQKMESIKPWDKTCESAKGEAKEMKRCIDTKSEDPGFCVPKAFNVFLALENLRGAE